MDRLEALTEQLVRDLSEISVRQQDHVIYDLEQGEAITFTLKEDRYCHILDSFLAAGTIFPLHEHEASAETLILQRGSVTIVCDEPGCETIHHELQPGRPFFIPSGLNHFLHAKENSWILAILIPPDAGIRK